MVYNFSFSDRLSPKNNIISINNITGNNITDNKDKAIRVWSASYKINICGNKVDRNDGGIMVSHSTANISGNTITNNNLYGIILQTVYDELIVCDNIFQSNGIVIDWSVGYRKLTCENNIANGKPIRLYRDLENIIVPSDTAQVILIDCINFTIKNLHFSNVDAAIQLMDSHNNIIHGNNITDNNCYGIQLLSSDHNILSENRMDNNGYGIYLHHSNNNSIDGNNITGNKNYGVYIGITWFDSINYVINNNFIENNNHAYFYDWYHFYFFFHRPHLWKADLFWNQNYWDDSLGYIPRPIKGKADIEFKIRFFFPDPEQSGWGWLGITIPFPWINFDWHPAKEPYDIGG